MNPPAGGEGTHRVSIDSNRTAPVDSSCHAFCGSRDRRALKAGVAGVLVQVLSHGIRLMVIPLSIALLGVEQYGLFLVVGSLVAWGGAADLGLTPGLINVVASAQGRGDRAEMRRAVSTAVAAYGLLAVFVALLTVGVSQWHGLPGLLGARSAELAGNGRELVLICGFILAGNTVARVVSTTANALQEGHLSSYAHLAGTVGGLAALLVVAWQGGGLSSYALAVGLPPLLAQLGLARIVFCGRGEDLRPAPRWVNWRSMRTLWGFAGPLTVYQTANLVILYTANVMIASRLGAGAVPGYSVPYAAFAVLIGMTSIVVTPYLPAYAESAVRGDVDWAKRRSRQMTLLSAMAICVGGGVLVLAGPWLVPWWTRGAVSTDRALLIALLLFALTRSVGIANATYLIGIGQVRIVAAAFVVAAAVFLAGSWWLLPVVGLAAVPLAGWAGHTVAVGAGMARAAR